MSAGDNYLLTIIGKYAPNTKAAENSAQKALPIILSWGGNYLVDKYFSGSLAKGTSISLGTDADIFLSLSSSTPNSLSEIYESLYNAFTPSGYAPRKQNVSIGITVDGYSIDLVPGKRQSQYGDDHSLYKRKANSWTKTNVTNHISLVRNSQRLSEIKILKIWRHRHKLEFPSFFLEMAIIDALHNARYGDIATNVLAVLRHLRDAIQTARYVDPANTNNIISDDCTAAEKLLIANKARESLGKKTWEEIVW